MSNGLIRPGSSSLTMKERPKNQTHINVNEHELKTASRVIQDRADMNENIMVLLPELKQAKEIIISSIISPNDFSKKELIPDYNNSLNLPDATVAAIKTLTESAIVRHKIVDSLYDIAETSLFLQGASVELIIPRSKVEAIILHSVGKEIKTKLDLESYSTKDIKLEDIGFVNVDTTKKVTVNNKEIGLSDLNITYSGNPLSYATNEAYDKARNKIMKDTWYLDDSSRLDVESLNDSVLAIYDTYKKNVKERYINLANITSKDNKDDIPFRMKLNASTVLPIYTDDKSVHLGYFALSDEMNRAITKIPSDGDLVSSMTNFKADNNNQVLKMMVDSAATGMDSNKDHSVVLSNMLDIAENILLATINESVSNSVYRNTFNIESENSLVRIMLYRALRNMQTSLIFIPVEYMSYIAFDYRRNGTGKTILEDITLLASFKSMLLLSEVHAAIEHNIPITDVVVDIDPSDPEPFKTKEMLETNIYNANSQKHSAWGSTDIEKHGSWIQNAGLRVVWNHKDFPDTKITMDRKNRESAYQVDDATSEKITSMILKGLGLSPSILNDADNVEFASVAMISNSLTNKINNERQDVMNDGVSDLVRKLILSDTTLLKKFYELLDRDSAKILKSINDNLDSKNKLTAIPEGLKVQIVKDMIDGVIVRLPRAESKDRTELSDKFKSYMESLDEIMDTFKSTTYLSDVVSELGVSEDALLSNLKLHFAMLWCDEHNYARGMVKFMNIKDSKELKSIMDMINGKDFNMIELAKSISANKDKILSSIKPKEDIGTNDEPNDEPPVGEAGDEVEDDVPPVDDGGVVGDNKDENLEEEPPPIEEEEPEEI